MSSTLGNAGEQVYIGLGCNLGNCEQTLQSSLVELDQVAPTGSLCCSSFYTSKPMGPAEQPDYLNAVCGFSTLLDAHELLTRLQQIEHAHGRVRDGTHWGPRTLDLDLLLYGEHIIRSEVLQVPHPGIGERAFVLLPLAEIAAGLHIPGLGPIAELADGCRQAGIKRLHSG